MHGLLAESAKEPKGHQVEIAIDETVPTHELRLAILALLVVHHFLADLVESGIFSQIGDEAVHLAEHFDILHHLFAISFQTAVEVV